MSLIMICHIEQDAVRETRDRVHRSSYLTADADAQSKQEST